MGSLDLQEWTRIGTMNRRANEAPTFRHCSLTDDLSQAAPEAGAPTQAGAREDDHEHEDDIHGEGRGEASRLTT